MKRRTRPGIVIAVSDTRRRRGRYALPIGVLPALGLVLAAACLTAAPASAAEYALTPAGCVEDDHSATGCLQAAPALDDPAAVAVSPDGRSAYVAATADDAIAIFGRAADGSLTPRGCVGDTGTTLCGTGADDRQAGLAGVADLTVTPDGLHVFAVSPTTDAIVHLRRDPATGDLRPGGCYDGPSGADLCYFQIAGLDGARTVAAVDPPGADAFVFVGASTFGGRGALLRFSYGPSNLEDGGCVFSDRDEPILGCPAAEGLGGIHDIAFSPDAAGESLYAVGRDDGSIARFDQDGRSLDFAGCIADQASGDPGCAATAPGLGEPRGVAVSPDGAQVYVAASGSSALAIFNRDDRGLIGTPDGALSPIGCIAEPGAGRECGLSAPGLDAAFGVAAAPDGESVYVASIGGGLAELARPAPTGPLAPRGCLEAPGGSAGCAASAAGLGLNLGIAASPDGRSVYVTSSAADTLAILRRAPVATPPAPPSGPPSDPPPGAPPPGAPPAGAPPAAGRGGPPDAAPASPSRPGPPASRAAAARLRIVGLRRNRRAGTATLTVAVPRAGVLKLRRARCLRPARRRVRAAGRVRIVLRPDRRGRRRLRRRGALPVKARLALASRAKTTTTTKRVRLILRRASR